jgi:hypothetical protein
MIGWSLSKPFALPIGLVSDTGSFNMPKNFQIQFSSFGIESTIECDVMLPYTTVIDMALKKETATNSSVSWIDLGEQYDTRTCSFEVATNADNSLIMELLIKGRGEDEPITISGLPDGFFPFGQDREYPTEPIFVTILKIEESYTQFFNKYRKYKLTIGATLPRKTVDYEEVDCWKEYGFSLDGVTIPYPKNGFNTDINEKHIAFDLHNSFADIRHKSLFGGTAKITAPCTTIGAKKTTALLTLSRGTALSSVFPPPYYPFGMDAETVDSVKLDSAQITVSVKSAIMQEVTFSISQA